MNVPTVLTEPHPGPWTEEEFLALRDSGDYPGPRLELFDGCLLLNPSPTVRHQQITLRLANLLEAAAPTDMEVIHQVNLWVAPSTLFVPDVLVTCEPADLDVSRAEHVVLVAEVVTPYGGGQETILKHALYAEAEIPRYVMVDGDHDRGEPVASLHLLCEGRYVEAGRARPGELLRIDEPYLDLDPADLLLHDQEP